MKRITDFESALKSASPQSNTVEQLREDFHNFKEQIWSIIILLRQQISELNNTVDNLEMRYRRKYLLIGGVPEEPQQNLSTTVLSILKNKLGLGAVTSSDITDCHRLGKPTDKRIRPVLVRFANVSLKSEAWKKKTHFKGTPYVLSEFLTRRRQSLFMITRKRFGISNCWTRDGVIIVKLPDGRYKKIDTEEELSQLYLNAAEGSATGSDNAAVKITNTATVHLTRPKRTNAKK